MMKNQRERTERKTAMKRTLLIATLLSGLGIGGVVAAQAPANSDDHAAHHPAKAATPAPSAAKSGDTQAGTGGGMMGGGMMGGGMMGNGMMGGGMCGPMMGGANTKVDVKKIDKGVTITLTSPDAATAARLQKMAEAMRLMHEANTQ
jgi:hypothetical protein